MLVAAAQIFGRDVFHVEVVLPAGAEEGDFDYGTKDGASDPRPKMERLSHAVVGDLAKVRERGFSSYGAEVGVGVERLKELSGAHGFSEGEDAVGMKVRFVPRNRPTGGCRCARAGRRSRVGRRWFRGRGSRA